MATLAQPDKARPRSLAPDRTEVALGWLALVLLSTVAIALFRGMAHWGAVPWTIWFHLATMMTALALTPVMLWNQRGTPRHRVLGYVWVGCLATTAVISFRIRVTHPGHLSVIHVLSVFTLVMLPVIVFSARSGNVARHRSAVRGMVIGALLVAGFFALPPFRMLGRWLFG